MKKLLLSLVILVIASPAFSLEYQWKFSIPTMDTRESAVKVYELLDNINGVYDIEVNIERNSVMFFYDDDKTDVSIAKSKLIDAGYAIEKTMLLEEPKGGVMN